MFGTLSYLNYKQTKNALIAVNVLFITFGAALAICSSLGEVETFIDSISMSFIFAGFGAVYVFAGFLGLLCTWKQKRALIFIYMTIITCTLVIQLLLIIGCLAISNMKQDEIAQKAWSLMNIGTKMKVQEELACCGYDESTLDVPRYPPELPWQETFFAPVNPMWHPDCYYQMECCQGDLSGDCTCPPCKSGMKETINFTMNMIEMGCGTFGIIEFMTLWLIVRFRNQKEIESSGSFL